MRPSIPAAFVASSASWRTLGGALWTMLCSRLDLFQTGVTSTPSCSAFTNAAKLRFALVGEAVADSHRILWEVHILHPCFRRPIRMPRSRLLEQSILFVRGSFEAKSLTI